MNGNRNKFKSLATRLSFWVALLGVLIFSAVLSSNYYLTRNLLRDYIRELALQAVSSSQHEIETIFNTVATGAESLAMLAADTDLPERQIHESIKTLITTHPDIFGMTVALEPDVLRPGLGEFSPYYYRIRSREALDYADLAAPKYRYLEQDWYTKPKNLGTSTWAEPYWDFGGGNVLMTTYSVPIWTEKNDTFAGIATADIELDWLEGIVNNIRIGDSGYGFIVSQNNVVISHPNESLNMKPMSEVLPGTGEITCQRVIANNRFISNCPAATIMETAGPLSNRLVIRAGKSSL